MGKIALVAFVWVFSAVSASAAPVLTYLRCELPRKEQGKPPTIFDFTLDEQNSTVSFYVKEADTTNKEKAVFGPETVTWISILSLGSITLTRTISRVDLSFTEELNIGGSKTTTVGTCSLVKAPTRQF